MLVKCICTNCAGHLEFEEENSGEKIKCPHCGFETTLYLPGHEPEDVLEALANERRARLRHWLFAAAGVVLLAAIGYGLYLCGSYVVGNFLPQPGNGLTAVLILVLVCLSIPFALFWLVFPVLLSWQLYRLTQLLGRMAEKPVSEAVEPAEAINEESPAEHELASK